MTRQLWSGTVLRVAEGTCTTLYRGEVHTARFAAQFPTPHVERVSPGHLVALASAPDGSAVVLWRWYDAVVLGDEGDLVRLWEPAHGEVLARPRDARRRYAPGTRAYLSAGLPGADWWVAGPVSADPAAADVELAAVADLVTAHDLWSGVV